MPDRTAASAPCRGDAPAEALAADAPLNVLSGVGPVAAARLAASGLRTVRDLLRFFPRRLEELAEIEVPSREHLGQRVRITGRVDRCTRSWLPGRRSVVAVTFAARDGTPFRVSFFNQPYLEKTFRPGVERQLEGTLALRAAAFVLEAPRVVPASQPASGPCVVRYAEIAGVSEQRLRSWIASALERADARAVVDDDLPCTLRDRFAMPVGDPAAALRAMHRPVDTAEHEAARRWFALAEAVALFREVERLRRARAQRRVAPIPAGGPARDLRERCIPFRWTPDQERAVAALLARLATGVPMGVLLQGDVGTGKTAVALAVALTVVAAGQQVAFLAPTELLAEQHAAVVGRWLAGSGVEVALLTATLEPGERRAVEARVASGAAGLVFGTHALLSRSTRFLRLGLAIVDEQHRFGVAQRAALFDKGDSPHVLVMTATPIPRTLAMTLFGDLDVEVLRDLPAGRRPVRAVPLERDAWPRVLRTLRRHLARGGRAYVVCPEIGADGEKGSAVRVHRELAAHFASELVHGRMAPAARQRVLDAFRSGGVSVLVGTTVLEVGVDVPEATLMVVVHAERFGLATLHQLRGRVGRGARRGLCLLVGEPGPRTRAVASTSDGFALAEHDLRLRGAGELLGVQQSGDHDFKALDPLDDFEILRQARDAVRAE